MDNINNTNEVENVMELNFIEQLSKNRHFEKIFEIKIIKKVCRFPLIKKIFDHKIIRKFINREMIMYLIFGFLATVLNFFTFVFFRYRVGLELITANFLAIVCSVIFAFFTNKIWVFRSKTSGLTKSIKEFFRYIIARGITMITELLGVPFLVYVFVTLGMQVKETRELLSKGILTVIVIIANYILSKKAIFNKM